MNYDLKKGYELLGLDDLAGAEVCFKSVWAAPIPYATPQDKYLALKGYCRILDLRGKWYESETQYADGFRQLTQPNLGNVTGPFGMVVPASTKPGTFVLHRM